MKLLFAVAAGLVGYCYYRGMGAHAASPRPHELHRWEGEGGNLPSAATPRAQPSPPDRPIVRH